jgi:SAM-dependent methyltransferase
MFEIKHVTTSEQVRAVYDTWHAQRSPVPLAAMFTWLLRQLAAKPGQTLLDVACGDARLGIAARAAGLIYYGVDISYVAVRSSDDCRVLVGEGAQLPFGDNCFDYVTSIGSLEHYLDMAQGVQELARVLKYDGRAFVLVPNAFSVTWNVLNVLRTGDLYDEDGQPIQRFGTRRAWQKLLTANGLQVVRALGYERAWPQTLAEWRHYMDQPKEAILALAVPFLPLNLTRCLVFLCSKRDHP